VAFDRHGEDVFRVVDADRDTEQPRPRRVVEAVAGHDHNELLPGRALRFVGGGFK
jgi:hypothetical protein